VNISKRVINSLAAKCMILNISHS